MNASTKANKNAVVARMARYNYNKFPFNFNPTKSKKPNGTVANLKLVKSSTLEICAKKSMPQRRKIMTAHANPRPKIKRTMSLR